MFKSHLPKLLAVIVALAIGGGAAAFAADTPTSVTATAVVPAQVITIPAQTATATAAIPTVTVTQTVTASSSANGAPALTVAAGVLHWAAMSGVTSYNLATILDPTGARATTYQTVTGTSFTPPAVPGQTVNYGLEANQPTGAPWSTEVTITWPAATRAKLVVSVNNTTGWGVDSTMKSGGINATRDDIGDGSGTQTNILGTSIADGMNPLPIFTSGSGGNLAGMSTATVTTDINALKAKLATYNIKVLEFGNESYLSESAAAYGAQYNAAHIALAGTGITLLACVTTDAVESDRGGAGSWFNDLKNALPGGAGEVDAFDIHPYGAMTSVQSGDGYGWPMMGAMHTESVADGYSATLPWYVTEVGQDTTGTLESSGPVTQAVAGTDMTKYLNDVRDTYTWVVWFNYYASEDDGTGGFGIVNSDWSHRPAFNAMAAWIAANPTVTNG